MAGEKADVLLLGPPRPLVVDALSAAVKVHKLAEAKDRNALFAEIGPRVRAMAVCAPVEPINEALMSCFPRLEIVSSFGVGYDHVDAKWAGAHGITVTNTPDVLNEEVADIALGLLLCTVREFPQAERYLRAGKWTEKAYPLSKGTLRDRTVWMVGLGRIGKAIARRLDAFGVPVVYHARNAQAGTAYRYYPNLLDMARDVDTLMIVVPGGAATERLINAAVLEALGSKGILINMSPAMVLDQAALIDALQSGKIMSAGLDVAADHSKTPKEFMALDNVVLFPDPHSASPAARRAMDQLVIDNLLAWAAGKPPLTPVAETPWPPKR
jgi:lactate dehydrogenase-like 2-hydroxyacid dehydrogenase